MQQTARKVAVAILQIVNELLPQTKDEANKNLASRSVDSTAMLGHMCHELSRMRREQIRPVLKREFAAICSKDIPNDPSLFGSDLQKQLKEAKEMGSISHSLATPSRKRFNNSSWKPYEYKRSNYPKGQYNNISSRGRRDFFSKGYPYKPRKKQPPASKPRS
jgi:hypothetical protein